MFGTGLAFVVPLAASSSALWLSLDHRCLDIFAQTLVVA